MIELRGKSFVVREYQRRAIRSFDNFSHGECLAGTGDAEQNLVLVSSFDAAKKLTDRRGLVSARLVRALEFESHEGLLLPLQ